MVSSMTDYALVRSRSAAIRSRSVEPSSSLYTVYADGTTEIDVVYANTERRNLSHRPLLNPTADPARFASYSNTTFVVTRTRSVPDLTGYFRYSDKYRPQWHSVWQSTPYRWRRDWDLYDDYWYDKYYYFSPLYSSYTPRRRYYYSDYLPNPYYWSSSSSYWTRYKGYWYDYDYPSYYRRTYDSAFNRYLSSTYTPYRSYLLDSLSTSLGRGLSMYKAGLIPYSTLDAYWLTPKYWDRRFKDWRELYCTTKDLYLPSTYDRKARQYFAQWA